MEKDYHNICYWKIKQNKHIYLLKRQNHDIIYAIVSRELKLNIMMA